MLIQSRHRLSLALPPIHSYLTYLMPTQPTQPGPVASACNDCDDLVSVEPPGLCRREGNSSSSCLPTFIEHWEAQMQSHKKTEQICRKKLRETLSQSKVYDFLASNLCVWRDVYIHVGYAINISWESLPSRGLCYQIVWMRIEEIGGRGWQILSPPLKIVCVI